MDSQYGNLGKIYFARGDLDEAERMVRQSLEMEEKLGRLEGMASQYGNLGVIYRTRGDLDEAGRSQYSFSLQLLSSESQGWPVHRASQVGRPSPSLQAQLPSAQHVAPSIHVGLSPTPGSWSGSQHALVGGFDTKGQPESRTAAPNANKHEAPRQGGQQPRVCRFESHRRLRGNGLRPKEVDCCWQQQPARDDTPRRGPRRFVAGGSLFLFTPSDMDRDGLGPG